MTCLHSGDNESGKTTLVSKLQGAEDQKKGSALEYMYVTVKDEYGDGLCIMLCYICKFVCILSQFIIECHLLGPQFSAGRGILS